MKNRKNQTLFEVEDENDSDDAIIDEFLPSQNQSSMVSALTSALGAEPPSDDDEELDPVRPSSVPVVTQSTNHSDDGTVPLFYFIC